jgi:hypothetical protein
LIDSRICSGILVEKFTSLKLQVAHSALQESRSPKL